MRIPSNLDEARSMQMQLVGRLNGKSYVNLRGVHTIAGIDASYINNRKCIIVGLIVFSFPDLSVLTSYNSEYPVEFPYVPGYLAFREGFPIVKLIQEYNINVDLLIIDGHGIAHPRRLGLASFVGIMTNLPSVGIAKKRLVGYHGQLSPEKHARVPIYDREEVIGYVYRTRKNVKPVYISPGYRIHMTDCLELMKYIVGPVRIPIPTWEAHKFVTQLKTKTSGNFNGQ